MFKALYSLVNNIIEKIFTNLQPYPIIYTISKKGNIFYEMHRLIPMIFSSKALIQFYFVACIYFS